MSTDQVVRNADYFMANTAEFEALTDEQHLELLNKGHIGEAPAASESLNEEVAEPVKDENLEAAAAVVDVEDDTAKDVKVVDESAAEVAKDEKVDGILAKDGKNIIPFARLEATQNEVTRLQQELSDTKSKLIESLTEAKKADEETGGTQAQEDVLAELKEEFPELADKLAPAISKLVEQGVKSTVEAMEAKLNTLLKPLQMSAEDVAMEKHLNAIRASHSDLDKLMSGDTVDKWIETQPSLLQGRYKEVLDKGTVAEVVELLGLFKEATKTAEPANVVLSKEQIAQAAKDAVEKAKKDSPVPKTLSDIPAGSVQNTDELSAMADLNPLDLLTKFEGKSPAQIEALLNKII